MKFIFYFSALAAFFAARSIVAGQNIELAELLAETESVARKTGYQAAFEFTFDFKRTVERKNRKTRSQTFEAVCSKKQCEYILVAEDGKSFSTGKIRKNREKAAKKLNETETFSESTPPRETKENPGGYGFMIYTNFSLNYSYFSPNLYLKNCETAFAGRTAFENRPTIKVRATNCGVENENYKTAVRFMPETEAFVWIDEKDKAIVKIEIFAVKEFKDSSVSGKPIVVMETARVPEGFWFWKRITIEAATNNKFFPEDYGNWQIELYNYKRYAVNVDKVNFDKN